MLKANDVVTVMNSHHARIFKLLDMFDNLIQIEEMHYIPSAQEHDKPGRVFEGGITMKHAYEKKTSTHDKENENFVIQICEHLIEILGQNPHETVIFLVPHQLQEIIQRQMANWEKRLKMIIHTCDIVKMNKKEIENYLIKLKDFGTLERTS